jgi:hypothetical protein
MCKSVLKSIFVFTEYAFLGLRSLLFPKHPAASTKTRMKWRARTRDTRAVRLRHDGELGFEWVFSIR